MSDPETNEPQHGGAALEAARRVKLRKIQEMGIDPWGHRFDNHTAIGKIRAREDEIVAEPAAEPGKPPKLHGPKVRAAGRIVLLRRAGKLIFLDLHDWTGRIQVAIGMKQVGEKNWELTQQFDLGDLIGIDGELSRTKVGELTIFASDVHFLTKCIETPPEKHKGLTDPELRQRMRYLDLIHTEGQWERFLRRTKIVQSIRNTLGGRRLRRGRRPDAARHRRRRGGAALHHAPQCPGHRPLPPHRPGTAPEAADGGRRRAGL